MSRSLPLQITFDFSNPQLKGEALDDLEDETQKIFRVIRDLEAVDYVRRVRIPPDAEGRPSPRRFWPGMIEVELPIEHLATLLNSVSELLQEQKLLQIQLVKEASSLKLVSTDQNSWQEAWQQMQEFADQSTN